MNLKIKRYQVQIHNIGEANYEPIVTFPTLEPAMKLYHGAVKTVIGSIRVVDMVTGECLCESNGVQ